MLYTDYTSYRKGLCGERVIAARHVFKSSRFVRRGNRHCDVDCALQGNQEEAEAMRLKQVNNYNSKKKKKQLKQKLLLRLQLFFPCFSFKEGKWKNFTFQMFQLSRMIRLVSVQVYNDKNKDETFSSSLVFVHVQSELVLDQ